MQVALKVCDDREKRGRVHAIFRNCPFLPTPLDTKMAADEACPVIVVTAKDLTDEDRTRLTGGVELIVEKGALTATDILGHVRSLVGRPDDLASGGETI